MSHAQTWWIRNMKDKENSFIFNYPLSKKDKKLRNFSFFLPHEGVNNFYARVLWGEMRKPQNAALSSSPSTKGLCSWISKLNTGMKSLIRSSAKSGCYQFPQQFRRNSQLKVQKPEQTANRNQHIYEISLVICLVFWCPRPSCI